MSREENVIKLLAKLKYFTSCFKEEYGMTPSEFQKQQEKGDTSESKEG